MALVLEKQVKDDPSAQQLGEGTVTPVCSKLQLKGEDPMKVKFFSVFSVVSVAMLAFVSLTSAAFSKPVVTQLYVGHVEPIEGKTFLPWSTHDGARSLSTSVFVIQSGGKTLIGDPGIVRKGEWPKIMKKLADMGIQPKDVDYVWIDHHHPDHITHIGAFPDAAVVDFWSIYTDEVWTDHPDYFEVIPGVQVVQTSGHTKEDSSLLVDTDEGVMLITHMWWFSDLTPEIDPVGQDQPGLDKNRRALLKKADLIFPTHGSIIKNPFKTKPYEPGALVKKK